MWGRHRARGVVLLAFLEGACAGPVAERAPVSPDEKPFIVQTGDPVLRGRAAEVPPEEISTPRFQALIAHMIDVMRKAPGVGLAAPQIGVPLRVFVLEDRDEAIGMLS